jgi:hypothetical protein
MLFIWVGRIAVARASLPGGSVNYQPPIVSFPTGSAVTSRPTHAEVGTALHDCNATAGCKAGKSMLLFHAGDLVPGHRLKV